MIMTSYKPKEGQLLLTPTLREYFLTYFKGVKPKPLRMSGELFKAVMIDFLGPAQTGQEINEVQHKDTMINIIGAFKRAVADKDKVVKKRSYITGFSNKHIQLMLTYSTYPVPHLPWAGITLTTLDVGKPGAPEQLIKYVSWEVCYNDEVPDQYVDFYNAKINRVVNVDDPLVDGLVGMIFEMVSPPPLSEVKPKELSTATTLEFNKHKGGGLIDALTEAILQSTEPVNHSPNKLPVREIMDLLPTGS